MKVCFVTFEYPPFVLGGAGVYALHITKELSNLGHEVHVISPRIEHSDKLSIENNVFVHRVPVILKPFCTTPSFWLSMAKEYVSLRKWAGGFDIVHSNGVSDLSLIGLVVREPRIVTVHHLAQLVAWQVSPLQRFFDLSGETGLSPFIERIVISRANKIISVSNFTKDSLVSVYGIDASKIEVVPQGIDLAEYSLKEDEIEVFKSAIGLNNDTTFLFVGRLGDPRKNLLLLLRAFKIIRKNLKPAKLLLVGSDDKSKVKEEVKSLGIDKDITILGYVDDTVLGKCYAACDVVVSTSLLEGFGLVMLEGMAAGKPIIALRRGAACELVEHGLNGLFVNNQDPQELAAAMTFFVDHPDAGARMGRISREKASRDFSWRKSAELTDRIYKLTLDKAQSSGHENVHNQRLL
jgi:glycosyltransferase involved in cell wall biosynthesis